MLDSKQIGDKINHYRVSLGYSQETLSELLFVSRQAVSQWEHGITLPSIDSIIGLSALFGITVDELLCLDHPIKVDEQDLFKRHDRNFILEAILSGRLIVDIPENFYQFNSEERLKLLSSIKRKELKVDLSELIPKLTVSEQYYIRRS